MRAIRFHGKGDVRLDDVAAPGPVGPREVLLKPRFCGICGTDLHEYLEGARVIPSKPHPMTGAMLPQIIGHELSADVIEVGSDVVDTKPGDRISLMPLLSCGRCYYCLRGRPSLCVDGFEQTNGLRRDGGMAEYMLVKDARQMLYPIPDKVSFEDAVLTDTMATALRGIMQSAFQMGDNVVVSGAGPIGLAAVQFL